MTTIMAGVFCGSLLVLYGVLLLRAWLVRPPLRALPQPLPRVSILVAARNEAPRIERCLRALAALDYPAEGLEILIGDDGSTDDTAAVVARFIQDKPQFRLVPVRHRLGRARGKSNVLAHLTRAATTDYFFITDADMQVSPGWVRTLLAALPPGGGVVTGITTSGGSLFGQWQGLDWLLGLSLVRVLTDWGLPVSAVGNNMLVSRNAYATTGGYESFDFSITEDVQLFEQLVAGGWPCRNLVHPGALGVSEALPTVQALLMQRKRWLRGTRRLPWSASLLFASPGLYYAALGSLGLSPTGVLAWYAGKLLLQTIFLKMSLRQAGYRAPWPTLLLYDAYWLVMSLAVLAYAAWPGAITWKARRYEWAQG